MRVPGAAIVIFLLTSLAQAQQPAPVVSEVALADPSSPVRTQLPRTGGILGQPACDKNGAVYLQPEFVTDSASNVLPPSVIVRINPDGSIANFSAGQADGANRPTYVLGHAIDRDGRVFLLTMRPGPGDHVSIEQAAPDSSYVSKTDLDRELRPGLFAVLPSGDFLVGGVVPPKNKEDTTRKSVLWLFGSDGSFKREFLAASSTVATDPKTKRPVDAPAPKDFNSIVIGDDGNIYVLVPGSPAKVQVFDEQGQKQRTLKLDPPQQARLDPIMFVSGGRVVVRYSRTEQENGKPVSKRIFRMYDAQTGMAQIDYVSGFRGIVACLDNNDLVFLVRGQDGALSLARASMR